MGFFSDFKEDLTQAVDGFSEKRPGKVKDGLLDQLSEGSEKGIAEDTVKDDEFGSPVVDMNESAMDVPLSDSLMADQNEEAMDEPETEAFDFNLSSLLSSVGVPVKDEEVESAEQNEEAVSEVQEPVFEPEKKLETIDIDPEISTANMTFEAVEETVEEKADEVADKAADEVTDVDFSFGTNETSVEEEVADDITVEQIYADAPAEVLTEGEVSIEQVLTEDGTEEKEELTAGEVVVETEPADDSTIVEEDAFTGDDLVSEVTADEFMQSSENTIAGEDELDMGETAEVLEEEIVTDGVDLSFASEPEEAAVENIVNAEESIDMSDDQLKNLQIPELEEGEVADETGAITLGMCINGDITSEGNLDVLGVVRGNIHIRGKLNISGSVTGNSKASEIFADSAKITGEVISTGAVKVGQESVILGNITASSAVIAGAVKGDIDVHGPVILDTSAIVMGDIKSKSVQINNGAVIEGHCSQCYAEVSPTSFFDDLKSSIGERKK